MSAPRRREKAASPHRLSRLVVADEAPVGAPSKDASRANAWMITFTDLVALLLTFFVMMFSMMNFENQVWFELRDSLSNELDVVGSKRRTAASFDLDLDSVVQAPGKDLDYLTSLLKAQMPEHPALAQAWIERAEGRVIISLPGSLLFDSGAVVPRAKARDALLAIGGMLRNLDNRIEVSGHADPSTTRGQLPSNWELSLQRAAAVAEGLRQAGYRAEIVVRGYGESRYQQLPGQLTESERMALARRTDIVIHESAGDLR